MLVGKKIKMKYDNMVVLNGINIEVKPGTITSLIGPSGSGKTTLLKVLSLLEQPQSGSLTFDDKEYVFPVDRRNVVPPWPEISVVFQQLFIWPHLSLRKNIELPLKMSGTLKQSVKYLNKLYKMFGMNEFLDRFPNEASIGQRQRTALVRALALKPKYLLLDEITSSLDVEQSRIILSHLAEVKKIGVGILMVTHDINFAISDADNVCFIDGGKIIKQGKPYEFLLETKHKQISSFINSAFLGSNQLRVYSGKEEFQAYHLALLERLPKNSVITIIGGLGKTWYGPMGDKYKDYDKLRVKKNITWDMLMYEYGAEDRRLVQEHPTINNFYVLSKSFKNLSDININSDGTIILQIFDPVPTVIEIKNQVLADSYMRYYKDFVKHGKKFLS